MDYVISVVKNTVLFFINGIDILKESLGIIFNVFPSNIKALLLGGFTFLAFVCLVKFLLSLKG